MRHIRLERRVAATVAVVAAALVTIGLLRPLHPAAAATTTIDINDNFYRPASVEIGVGDTVTWQYNGFSAHTTTRTASPETWDSGTLTKGSSFSHTFSQTGTFTYFCQIHDGMIGTIVVAAAGSTTPTTTATINPNLTPLAFVPIVLNNAVGW